MEDYQRNSLMEYENDCYKLDYNILAAHIDAQWRMMPHLFLNISTRTEYMAHANWLFMPRATLCYIPNKNFQLSFATGRYSQTPEDDYLATNKKSLGQSTADHAILSIQYKSPGTLIRIEPYWKNISDCLYGKRVFTNRKDMERVKVQTFCRRAFAFQTSDHSIFIFLQRFQAILSRIHRRANT